MKLFLGEALLLALAIFALWAIVSPRSFYWKLHAWRYRNPEAQEPSDATFFLWRVSSTIALIIFIAAGSYIARELPSQEAYRNCTKDLLPSLSQAFTQSDYGRNEEQLADAVQAIADENGLSVRGMPPSMQLFDGDRRVATIGMTGASCND